MIENGTIVIAGATIEIGVTKVIEIGVTEIGVIEIVIDETIVTDVVVAATVVAMVDVAEMIGIVGMTGIEEIATAERNLIEGMDAVIVVAVMMAEAIVGEMIVAMIVMMIMVINMGTIITMTNMVMILMVINIMTIMAISKIQGVVE